MWGGSSRAADFTEGIFPLGQIEWEALLSEGWGRFPRGEGGKFPGADFAGGTCPWGRGGEGADFREGDGGRFPDTPLLLFLLFLSFIYASFY